MEEPTVIVDPEVLDGFLQKLRDMRAQGALTDDQFHMCVCTLAYEFLIKHNNVDRTMVLLNIPPAEYFKGPFKEQLKSDKLFGASMFQMTYKLIQMGLAGIEFEKPNQPAAEA